MKPIRNILEILNKKKYSVMYSKFPIPLRTKSQNLRLYICKLTEANNTLRIRLSNFFICIFISVFCCVSIF